MRFKLALMSLLLPCMASGQLPSVASINLCTDQLVLTVADPSQILSVSWLSADPEESMFAARAENYALNYGSAEELLAINPDVVVAGTETSPYTRELLRRLGSTVIEIEPATSLEDVVRNVRAVGTGIGRNAEAETIVSAMRSRVDALNALRGTRTTSAVVVRPGGFTIGRDTLAHELITLAGLDNVVSELDRWGSLSVETLLATNPEIIVLTTYRSAEASRANSFFSHPGLTAIEDTIRLEVPARYFACGVPESLASAEILLDQMARP